MIMLPLPFVPGEDDPQERTLSWKNRIGVPFLYCVKYYISKEKPNTTTRQITCERLGNFCNETRSSADARNQRMLAENTKKTDSVPLLRDSTHESVYHCIWRSVRPSTEPIKHATRDEKASGLSKSSRFTMHDAGNHNRATRSYLL